MHEGTTLIVSGRELRVTIHDSIVESILRQPELTPEWMAPLMAFDKVDLKEALDVLYLKVTPSEYYPVLAFNMKDETVRYFAYGYDDGWWEVAANDEWFAGTRPPVDDERGTVSVVTGDLNSDPRLQVAVHKNAWQLIGAAIVSRS